MVEHAIATKRAKLSPAAFLELLGSIFHCEKGVFRARPLPANSIVILIAHEQGRRVPTHAESALISTIARHALELFCDKKKQFYVHV